MKVAVIGPGAIGCLFAARLAQAGHGVTLFDHNRLRAQVVGRQGIIVESDEGTVTVPLRMAVQAAELAGAELVLICVKAAQTRAVVESAAKEIGGASTVVSVQNGLGNAECLAERIAPARIVCAATGQGAILQGMGRVRHAGAGMTAVAAWTAEGADRAAAVAACFNGAGIPAEVERDASAMLWRKLALNAAINPLTALCGARNGRIAEHPEWRQTALAAMDEVRAVARAAGISLRTGASAEWLDTACRATAGNQSSMWQDILRKRPTEVDSINGAVVAEGKRLGVATPVNAMLLERVHALERGET